MGRLRETERAAGELVSSFDAFKLWVATIVLIGAGAVVFVGPGELPERLPLHQAIGLATMAFGLVFFVGFRGGGDAPGALAVRCRALNHALVFAFVGGLMLYSVGGDALTAWELSQDGVEAEATVGERHMGKLDADGNLLVRHRLHFAGFQPLVELDGDLSSGQTVRVLYLPDDGATFRINPSGTEFLDLVGDQGLPGTVIAGLGALFCLLAVLFNLRTVVLGSPEDPRERDGRA